MHAPHSGGGEFPTLFFCVCVCVISRQKLIIFHTSLKRRGLMLHTCGMRLHWV